MIGGYQFYQSRGLLIPTVAAMPKVQPHSTKAPYVPQMNVSEDSKPDSDHSDVTSIYARKTHQASSEQSAKKTPRVKGFQLEGWASSRPNDFASAEDRPKDPASMRVFLWCLEMKHQGPKYTGDSECQALLARQSETTRRFWR